MKIGFIVGDFEKHEMELSFDHTSGDLRVLMDGTPVLQDSPRLAREPVKHYELSIGNREKHMLALQLSFAGEASEPGIRAIPRLSLLVSPVASQDAVPATLGLNAADSVLAANTAATV